MRPIDMMPPPKERRLTETMSETSEGTTTTTATSYSGRSSVDNAEELRDLAAILGVADPAELQQERFRVDRRKLEQMLLGECKLSIACAKLQSVRVCVWVVGSSDPCGDVRIFDHGCRVIRD